MKRGQTPFSKEIVGAAGRADSAEVSRLLERGADPNATYRNYRPLHALIQEKPHAGETDASPRRMKTLELLLARGADPELLGAWPLARAAVVAAFVGSAPILDRLLEAGAVRTIFVDAARGDAEAVARRLAKDPALVTARDGDVLTALQCAAGSRLGRDDAKIAVGLVAAAAALLDAGADPNATARSWGHDVDTAYFACRTGSAPMLGLLLERGADPTKALPSALWGSRFDLATMAIEHGGSIDDAIDGDRPLLHNLIRWGQLAPALWLLERGADPNRTGAEGWTALHQAVSRGNARMIAALLRAGARTDVEAEDGRTPRMLAKELGRKGV
jgi:ankyrin repeat protein